MASLHSLTPGRYFGTGGMLQPALFHVVNDSSLGLGTFIQGFQKGVFRLVLFLNLFLKFQAVKLAIGVRLFFYHPGGLRLDRMGGLGFFQSLRFFDRGLFRDVILSKNRNGEKQDGRDCETLFHLPSKKEFLLSYGKAYFAALVKTTLKKVNTGTGGFDSFPTMPRLRATSPSLTTN
jgi:hypothetical protein